MRIGYGYCRSDKEFAEWDCEDLFLDDKRSHREWRALLFLKLREGDTLFMLAKGDLGYGKELQNLRNLLEEKGVTVEYPPYTPERRGRPAKFNPTSEQDDLLRNLWKNVAYSQAYVLRKASELCGVKIERHQMIYRYGKRSR